MLALESAQTTTTANDYLSSKFDGSIGLEKRFENAEYLRGYYEGLAVFLDW